MLNKLRSSLTYQCSYGSYICVSNIFDSYIITEAKLGIDLDAGLKNTFQIECDFLYVAQNTNVATDNYK